MTTVLAITNQKGGVGKTTTAINLGAALAALERRVLLVDCDPQGNATRGLGVEPEPPHLYHVLSGQVPIGEAIRETGFPNLRLVSAGRDLVGVGSSSSAWTAGSTACGEPLPAWWRGTT